jgi:O-antigen ligase
MFFNLKLKDYFFLSIFSLLPVTILIGPAISLINILLITLSFLVIFYKKLFFYILNERIIIILCILYSYLIFNTFISIDFESSFLRNFGFIRYIILFIAINFFFLNFENLKFIINFWIFVIFVVLFDVIFEAYNGYNILGFVSENKKRIVSFFKDQQVIGAFINGFVFVIIGFFSEILIKKQNFKKF